MFTGWMIDIAREQSPSETWLADLLRRTADAGFQALGLYLEHRYAYPSAPWAAAPGCVTPDMIARLRPIARSAGVRMIPFLNTLGHMEGFIRTRGGEWLAEGPALYSAQICPSRQDCVRFARGLVSDALDAFDDDWVHLGGDEAWQLGQCPRCGARAAESGPGALYAEYYGDLCRWVLARGRRPCLWADMLLKHPDALDALPRETLLFNWQYDDAPDETTRRLRAAGFDVINCPAVQSYHGPWCDLEQTQRNIDAHVQNARRGEAAGVMITTWELFTLATYESIVPLVWAAGRRIHQKTSWEEALRAAGGDAYAAVAEILGRELHRISPYLRMRGPARFRQALIGLLDPFELWRRWRAEVVGATGEQIEQACRRAAQLLDADHCLWPPLQTMRAALEWVRRVEQARRAYDEGDAREASRRVRQASAALTRLLPIFEAIAKRGGSAADPERLRRIESRIERVAADLDSLADRPEPHPSFATVVSPAYVPGAQAAWGTEGHPPIPPAPLA